jgi:hypothetical protein
LAGNHSVAAHICPLLSMDVNCWPQRSCAGSRQEDRREDPSWGRWEGRCLLAYLMFFGPVAPECYPGCSRGQGSDRKGGTLPEEGAMTGQRQFHTLLPVPFVLPCGWPSSVCPLLRGCCPPGDHFLECARVGCPGAPGREMGGTCPRVEGSCKEVLASLCMLCVL